jgi:formylglycine-generating enzyme required for sulfatase activity
LSRLTAAALIALIASCGASHGSMDYPEPLPLMSHDTSFVSVPGGTFVTSTGDTVTFSPFRLGRYEVTNRLYYSLAAEGGINLPPDPDFVGMTDYLFDFPDYPVVNVSAIEAGKAAAVLGGRLPTLAEWEYAASLDVSGDPFEQYPWGILEPVDAGFPANFLAGGEWETRALDGYAWTAPVDSFPLTGTGFACQAGNVSEWTLSTDSMTLHCGGAWSSPAERITIGSHSALAPGDRARHVGFRILLPGT